MQSLCNPIAWKENKLLRISVNTTKQNPKKMADELKLRYDIKSAAMYLGISTSHLYKLTSSGAIKHYKPGGKKIYFFQKDLDDYIRSGEVKTNDELETEATSMMA